MAKPWSQVAASPQFQALSPDDKEAARQQYFQQVVVPQLDQSDIASARAQFDAQTKPKQSSGIDPLFANVQAGSITKQGAANSQVDPLFKDAQAGFNYGTTMSPQEARGSKISGFMPLMSAQDKADAQAHQRYLERSDRASLHSSLGSVGDFISGAYHGITGAVDGVGDLASKAYDTATGNSGRTLSSLVSGANPQSSSQLREQDYRNQMSDSAAAKGGDIAANIAMAAIPASRLAKAGRIAQIVGGAGIGASQGALQPVTAGESRLANTAIGGIGGAVGAGIPIGLGAAKTGLGNLVSRYTQQGAENTAAQRIAQFATDKASLMRSQPSPIQGVQRSLPEESLDPGVASLYNSLGSVNAGKSTIRSANNAARQQALGDIAGTPDQLAQAISDRSAATDPLYDVVRNGQVDTSGLHSALGDLINRAKGNPTVQNELIGLRSIITPQDGQAASESGQTLLNMRDEVGHLLSGAGGKVTKNARQLLDAKSAIDNALSKIPEHGQANQLFSDMSNPIARMKIGQYLAGAKSGTNVLDPTTGLQVLTPSRFSGNARALDDVAAKATGFRKASANDVLSDADRSTISGIQDDLQRQQFADTMHGSVNSATSDKNQLLSMLGNGAAHLIPGYGTVAKIASGLVGIGQNSDQVIKQQMVALMNDPQKFRAVMQALPPAGRSQVQRYIAAMGQQGGSLAALALSPAASQQSTSP